jgi:hypothetical protein
MTRLADLPVYSNGDNEQQTTCPICGSRTSYIAPVGNWEHHRCLNPGCGYEFMLDLENDAPIDESDPLP